MADISSLGEMRPVEIIDTEDYVDSKGFQLPPKGEYLLQAPESFTFGRTNAGALSAEVSSKIAEGPFENFKLRYQKVSAKVFNRGGKNVSQLGDYLRSCGFRGRLTNEAEQADAIEQTANRVYKAFLDWRAFCKEDKYEVRGMDRFPSDGNGGHIGYAEHPTLKGDDGKPLRLRAQVVVERYIPATE